MNNSYVGEVISVRTGEVLFTCSVRCTAHDPLSECVQGIHWLVSKWAKGGRYRYRVKCRNSGELVLTGNIYSPVMPSSFVWSCTGGGES